MASVAPISAQLSDSWGVSSRAGYNDSRRGNFAFISISTKSRKHPENSGRLLFSSPNSLKDLTTDNPLFEEGIFETDSFSEGAEEEIPHSEQGQLQSTTIPRKMQKGGLVPEEWKHMQQYLHLSKKAKKTQFLVKQRENTQLNELRDELRRQRIDLLSEAEESAHAQSLAGRTQLLTPSQLVKLESDLSVKAPDPRFLGKFLFEASSKSLSWM
ncbi:hypothetical protein L7F22_035811 [Adiantum nelumboides]|nr:hypothetical protein [Adiantum nelumboides]